MDNPRVWLATVAVAAAGVTWWMLAGRAPQPPPLSLAPSSTAHFEEPGIVVHVAGAVVAPGVVVLSPSSRVADAVAASGGFATDADPSVVNLAAELVDGQQVVVPRLGEAPASQVMSGVITVNSATAANLEDLPGVGPVLAGRIVAFREEHGPFRVVEDLLDVPGIGEAKLAALRDLVRVP
ncbi:MAG: helix-hairpin-helix domain-containing protein [Acidimicrobiia bacterium]